MSNQMQKGNAWLVYIDIYGFSALVRSRGAAKIYKDLADCVHEIEKITKKNNFVVQVLSDSIFITCFESEKYDSDTFSTYFQCIREAQDILIDKDFIPRGAFAHGEIFKSLSVIVGEPVIRAVRAEEQIELPCVYIPGIETSKIPMKFKNQRVLPMKNGGSSIGLPCLPVTLSKLVSLIEKNLELSLIEGPFTVATALSQLKSLLKDWSVDE